jgi:hypothetical protein
MPEAKVILLMGATATGKTELALALSRRFEVEIVSVDSALIFRDMNIGTAKPDAEVLASVPHHLIDIVDPAESWSVWEFLRQSRQLVADIHQRETGSIGCPRPTRLCADGSIARLPNKDWPRCMNDSPRSIRRARSASNRPIRSAYNAPSRYSNYPGSRCPYCNSRRR